MTSTELERLIRKRLEAANLASVIDDRNSQFLEFPDGLFAELVVSDAAKLVDVERIGRELRESLRKDGLDLDVIVRSVWIVQDVEGPRPAISLSGGVRRAWAFPATLVSGAITTEVEVDVTQLAIDAIRRQLAGTTGEKIDENVVMREMVKEFLKLQVSFGGESYWDPIRHPQCELNESGVSILVGQAPVGKR